MKKTLKNSSLLRAHGASAKPSEESGKLRRVPHEAHAAFASSERQLSLKQEIELKILELPRRVFLQKMRKLGAKKLSEVLMRVKYFDFPDHRIQKARDLLRVRELAPIVRGKPKTEVVYKTYGGVKDGCKHFEECEFEILNAAGFEQASDFLKKLGFIPTLFYEKKRLHYGYKNWKFEFDEHPRIPSFLEIEAHDAAAIRDIIKKLDLGDYELTPETIEQVMRRKYPKVKLNGLKF